MEEDVCKDLLLYREQLPSAESTAKKFCEIYHLGVAAEREIPLRRTFSRVKAVNESDFCPKIRVEPRCVAPKSCFCRVSGLFIYRKEERV